MAGSSFTRGPGWQNWSLDMFGNWNSIGTDTNGDGNATDPGETDTRTHNMANEMLTRSLTSTIPNPYNYAYDDAGNATEITTGLNAKRRYTHDAWNRLVKAESGTVSGGTTTWTTTGQYQYNALHWRVVADGDRAAPTGPDQRRTMYYSAGWQMLQEDIDEHANGSQPDGVNSRAQEVWGLRYIDDAMVRLLDKNLDGDSRDSGELFWQLSDAQFSVIAIVDKNAVLQERVSYTSYGVGTHRWPHEVNNTGGVTTSGTTSDYGVINTLAGANGGAGTPISDTNYNVAADLNRDGVIDSTDTSIFTSTFGGAKSALAGGLISDPNGPDNVFGYDGYVYNADQGLYTVRFRWYSPTFGRWLERDPAGYTDDENLYIYVSDSAITNNDFYGLYEIDVHKYMTTWIAENMPGCFSKADAIAIGSADQGVDDNPYTSPGPGKILVPITYVPMPITLAPIGPIEDEPRQRYINRNRHALEPGNGIKDGVHGAGGNGPSLWNRATSSCDLADLGSYLHYLQDTYAHEGFTDDSFGHGTHGHRPDHANLDADRAMRMAFATFDALKAFAKKCNPDCYDKCLSGKSMGIDMTSVLRSFFRSPGGSFKHEISQEELVRKRRLLKPIRRTPWPTHSPNRERIDDMLD